MARIRISPRRVTVALGALAALLLLASVVTQFSAHVLGHPELLGLVPRLNADFDNSAAGWFSSALSLVVSLAVASLAAVARGQGERIWRHWAAIAALFALLSLEESVDFHSMAIFRVREHVAGAGPALLLALGLVAAAAVLLRAPLLAHARLWRDVPAITRRRLGLGVATGLFGAVVVDALTGAMRPGFGRELAVTFEEGVELTGLLLVLHTVLDRLRTRAPTIRIDVGDAAPSAHGAHAGVRTTGVPVARAAVDAPAVGVDDRRAAVRVSRAAFPAPAG